MCVLYVEFFSTHIITHLIFSTPHEAANIIIFILQMRKMTVRNPPKTLEQAYCVAQSHTQRSLRPVVTLVPPTPSFLQRDPRDFQPCFINQADALRQLILGGRNSAQFIWEELANHFPKGHIQEKIRVLKGTCLWRLIQKKCLFEISLPIPLLVSLHWDWPSPQLNLCFLGLLSRFKSGKHCEKENKCQSGKLAEGHSSCFVHPFVLFSFQLLFGIHKSKTQLAVGFSRDDNSAIFQMSKHSSPDLFCVDFEQAVVSGKILRSWVVEK